MDSEDDVSFGSESSQSTVSKKKISELKKKKKFVDEDELDDDLSFDSESSVEKENKQKKKQV